jgi:hypothetical protein
MTITAPPRPFALTLALALALLTLLGASAVPTARADSGVSASISTTATDPGVIPFVVPEGPVFTRPRDAGGTEDQELAWNLLVEHLLDASPKGATVTGSLFSLTDSVSQAALKRANKRGVKIRLLLYNRRADEKSVRSLVRSINGGKSHGSWAKVCVGSCYGSRSKSKKANPGVQHFKAFTFSTVMESATQATTNVWTAGSGNLTYRGSAFNSYVVKKNNPSTVATLNAYMVGMRADKQVQTAQARTVEEGNFKMYLYPQRKLTPDVIYDTLKHTSCVAPAGYGRNGRTVVRVGMFTWTPYRNIDDQLIRLRRAGCDVQVLVSLSTIDKAVMKHLIRGKVPVSNTLYNRGKKFYYIHDKNLIIDGVINGAPLSQVLTGSNNFTDGGLTRNTESIIRIRNKDITNQFLANWSLIRSYSKPVTKVSQLSATSTVPLDPDNMEPMER